MQKISGGGGGFSLPGRRAQKGQAAKPRLLCQRVEDNAFHLSCLRADMPTGLRRIACSSPVKPVNSAYGRPRNAADTESCPAASSLAAVATKPPDSPDPAA